MKEEPVRGVQLLLTVPVFTLEAISEEAHRRLVAALADLLFSLAVRGVGATEGGADEREDSR